MNSPGPQDDDAASTDGLGDLEELARRLGIDLSSDETPEQDKREMSDREDAIKERIAMTLNNDRIVERWNRPDVDEVIRVLHQIPREWQNLANDENLDRQFNLNELANAAVNAVAGSLDAENTHTEIVRIVVDELYAAEEELPGLDESGQREFVRSVIHDHTFAFEEVLKVLEIHRKEPVNPALNGSKADQTKQPQPSAVPQQSSKVRQRLRGNTTNHYAPPWSDAENLDLMLLWADPVASRTSRNERRKAHNSKGHTKGYERSFDAMRQNHSAIVRKGVTIESLKQKLGLT